MAGVLSVDGKRISGESDKAQNGKYFICQNLFFLKNKIRSICFFLNIFSLFLNIN